MEEALCVHISQGTIENFVQETLRESQPAIKLLEEQLKQSSVVDSDESGCYNNKKLDWAWIARTAYITLCFRATGRSSKVLEERFGHALKQTVAVTDRHSAYFALDFLNHQVCPAHLWGEPEFLTEPDEKRERSKGVSGLLRSAIHQRNIPPRCYGKENRLGRLDELLKSKQIYYT